MKISALILIFALIITPLFSQNKWSIGFSGGAAIPVGAFGMDVKKVPSYSSKNISYTDGNGYAANGYYVSFNVDRLLSNYFGISIGVSYINNPCNSSASNVIYRLGQSDGLLYTYTGGAYWVNYNSSVGVFLKIPLGASSINISPGIVFNRTQTPTFPYTSDGGHQWNYGGEGVNSIAYNISLSYRYSFKRMYLSLSSSYLYANTLEYGSYEINKIKYSLSNPISLIQIGLGTGIAF